jgi:hypothetical protein
MRRVSTLFLLFGAHVPIRNRDVCSPRTLLRKHSVEMRRGPCRLTRPPFRRTRNWRPPCLWLPAGMFTFPGPLGVYFTTIKLGELTFRLLPGIFFSSRTGNLRSALRFRVSRRPFAFSGNHLSN